MTAFNVVRFRVKPGRDEDFLEAHRRRKLEWSGMRRVTIIKTGERSYCFIGEWDSMQAMAAARPHMIATLDTFRDTLGVRIPTKSAVDSERRRPPIPIEAGRAFR